MVTKLPRALLHGTRLGASLVLAGVMSACGGATGGAEATSTARVDAVDRPAPPESSGGEEEEPAAASTGDSLAVLGDERPRGELPRARIEAGLSSARPALGACIQRSSARGGEDEGRVVVTFVIEPDGRVSAAAYLVSTLTDEGLAACILDVFRGLRFDAPEGGIVMVSHPFQFRLTGPSRRTSDRSI
jgi:TonB family protein